MNKLELNNISKAFSEKKILNDVSLQFSNGIYGILGENGTGKSTLLKIIAGLSVMDEGCIKSNGDIVDTDLKAWKSRIGYLPQFPGYYNFMTPFTFLEYSLRLSGWGDRKRRTLRVQEILNLFEIERQADQLISNLSGGIKQRIAISQAIIHDPEILLLDEPTNNLDENARRNFHNMILELSKTKIILYVGHIIDELKSVCSKLVVFFNGKTIFYGAPLQLIEEEKQYINEVLLTEDELSLINKKDRHIYGLEGSEDGYHVKYDNRFFMKLGGYNITPTLSEAYRILINKTK